MKGTAFSCTPRRKFMGQIGAGLALLTGVGSAGAGAQGTRPAHRRGSTQDHENDAWMKNLTGMHRQFFHAFGATGVPGLMAKNYLDAYAEAYSAPREHVNAVVGVHGPALAIALNDVIWKKYALGQKTSVNDPATQQPAERNVFASGSDTSVQALQERGVVFLVCNMALRLSSAMWSPAVSQTPEATYAELRENLLAATILTPALVIAINRAQEAGFTYVRAS